MQIVMICHSHATKPSEPILFEFQERETYPMWLEFDKDNLPQNLIDIRKFRPDFEPEKVFLCPQTIYFDSQSFRCIFSNPKHLQDTKIDSESYRNVKTVSKFSIMVESAKFFTKSNFIGALQLVPNSLLKDEIEKDRRFNHFKGFLYGYAIGELSENSPKKKELFALFSELQSTFTNAKSQLIFKNAESEKNYGGYGKGNEKSYGSYKTKFDYKPPVYNPTDSKKELLDLLSQTEKLYFTLFPNNQQLQNDPATERAKEILSILQQENAEPMLLNECDDFITSLIIRNKPFDLLKQAVKDFFKLATSKAGLNADETEYSERRFKSNVIKIQKQAEQNFLLSDKQPNGIDLSVFEFRSSFEVGIDKTKMKLNDTKEYVLFEIIIAYILKNPRPKKQGEITREEKAEMIKGIGSNPIFQTQLGNRSNPTEYYNDFIALWEHFTKLSDLRYENIKSNILKNFACFISKIDRFDELIEFTENKNIRNRKIAYAFWCAFNGFSEISEKNSKVIFASENLPLINSFDNYLNSVLSKLERETFDFENVVNDESLTIVEPSFLEKATNVITQTFSSALNNLLPNDNKEQVTENEKLAEVERYLQMLRNKIWTLPTIQKMNSTQQDDISKGLAQSTEKILSEMRKGTEIYTNKTYVHNVLKRSISENNKKRKKAEYKISDDQLVKVIQEIETLHTADK